MWDICTVALGATNPAYTWNIVKCIDPDGTRLNEGWFKGPFTVTNYAKNFYRPGGTQQAEWTFPVEYKNYSFFSPIAETQALMTAITALKPVFIEVRLTVERVSRRPRTSALQPPCFIGSVKSL